MSLIYSTSYILCWFPRLISLPFLANLKFVHGVIEHGTSCRSNSGSFRCSYLANPLNFAFMWKTPCKIIDTYHAMQWAHLVTLPISRTLSTTGTNDEAACWKEFENLNEPLHWEQPRISSPRNATHRDTDSQCCTQLTVTNAHNPVQKRRYYLAPETQNNPNDRPNPTAHYFRSNTCCTYAPSSHRLITMWESQSLWERAGKAWGRVYVAARSTGQKHALEW